MLRTTAIIAALLMATACTETTTSTAPAAADCPVDVSEADRALYPACN